MGSFPETYNDPGSRQLDKEYINADDVKGGAGGGGVKKCEKEKGVKFIVQQPGGSWVRKKLVFLLEKAILPSSSLKLRDVRTKNQ